jgi:Helix-turn-helix domain
MEELRMSLKECIRLEALGRVKRGEVTVVEAAELAGLSLRQARRVWKRFKAEGDAGLIHKLRGRLSNRRLPVEVRDRVVKRHQEQYADFGATLACEKLADEGLVLSPDTLTALLKERGLWQRQRRRGRHRKRRERRACLGSLVQMDGSHHDWFEGRGVKCVLMVMIDDATNRTYARLYPAETTEAAFDVFGRWINRQGLPRSLYVDRHSIYRDEDHPDRPTQFGRAMKDLSVELIQARSPQAKGRVERRNAVFQDRLVKEMRLRKINDLAGANALLEGKFLDELNGKYAVSPRREQDLPPGLGCRHGPGRGSVRAGAACGGPGLVRALAKSLAADRQPACVIEPAPAWGAGQAPGRWAIDRRAQRRAADVPRVRGQARDDEEKGGDHEQPDLEAGIESSVES